MLGFGAKGLGNRLPTSAQSAKLRHDPARPAVVLVNVEAGIIVPVELDLGGLSLI